MKNLIYMVAINHNTSEYKNSDYSQYSILSWEYWCKKNNIDFKGINNNLINTLDILNRLDNLDNLYSEELDIEEIEKELDNIKIELDKQYKELEAKNLDIKKEDNT